MTWLLFLFLFLFGTLTSFWDIKKGKIPNRILVLAIVFAVVWNLFSNFGYLADLWLNGTIAFGTGFAAWRFRLWTAGDAKLFFAYTLLVPLGTYNYGHIRYFPAVTILLNTLVMSFGYLCIKLIADTRFNEKRMIFARSFRIKAAVTSAAYLFGLFWGVGRILNLFGIAQNIVLWLILGLFLLKKMEKYGKKSALSLALGLSALRIVVEFSSLLNPSFWVQFIALFFVFSIFLGYVTNLGKFKFSANIRFSELTPGMVTDEMVLAYAGIYKKVLSSGIKPEAGGRIIIDQHKSLVQSQINRLKALQKNKKLNFNCLKIQQTLPFAPLLFLGVILTLLFQGSVIDYVKIVYVCPSVYFGSGLVGLGEIVSSACQIAYY